MMAAGQRLQLIEGATQVPQVVMNPLNSTSSNTSTGFSHILLDPGGASGGYQVLDQCPGGAFHVLGAGGATFRFDPHHLISSGCKDAAEDEDDDDLSHLHLAKKSHHTFYDCGTSGGGIASGIITHGASSSSPESWLDHRLWSRLPEKLVDRVLALLPPRSFFRFRVVCRRWYSLLFSDSFLELCSGVSPQRHCFLLFRPGVWTRGLLYDPSERSWISLPLNYLPSNLAVVSSSQGLLCCMSEMAGYKSVILCNPLTRACVQLPVSLKERFVPTVGLVVDRHDKSYRILAAGDDLISPFAVKNLTTEVFDSSYHSWKMAGALPRLCNLESAKTTFANGCFYCMNYSPFGVLAYDLNQGSWSKIQAPMRRFLRTPNLVECRGRLVMVAAVEKNRLNVPKSIRIWGLQHPKNVWVELERMPQPLYEEFMKVSCERAFYCIGNGNYILITIQDSSEMLLYDFYEKLWRWLPRCPFLGDEGTPGFMQGFAFSPRLDAAVLSSEYLLR